VSTPDDLQFVLGHPMPNEDHAALLSSYHLLREQAKDVATVNVRSTPATSVFESWEVTRAAFMARMTSTLAHLGYLAPSYSRLDGFALARTLVDHAITFAWLSGDPRGRLPAFIKSSFESFTRKDDAAEPDDKLLDDATRKGFEAYVDAHSQDVLPRLPRRAEQADASWGERVKTTLPESLQLADFSALYHKVYGNYATYDHPTTLGLHVFVHVGGSPPAITVNGEPERDRKQDLRRYWIAMFAFAEALIVSNLASGRPRIQPLRETLELIGTLRQLDRDGRLAVEQTPTGTTVGVRADEDESQAGDAR
jgi:hypothetical protein